MMQRKPINLVICSNQRDTVKYPNINSYVLDLDEPILDVRSVRLISWNANFTNGPIVIRIENINRIKSPSSPFDQAFAVLNSAFPVITPIVHNFDPDLSGLHRLNIQCFGIDGTAYDFVGEEYVLQFLINGDC